MKFSVIVPIFNVKEYLYQCVESVLKQTFNDFELILVDDGSYDGCSVVCDDYSSRDSRVKTIHKRNGGLVSARKVGAEVASGDYCIALDGDDWMKKDLLEKVNNVISLFNPDVIRFGLVEAYVNGSKEPRPLLSYREGFYSKNDIDDEIMPSLIYGSDGKSFPASICGSAIKRELYKKEQLEVNDIIKIGEDAAVMHPIHYYANSIYVMMDCLYFYRVNESSMTKNRKPFSLENPIVRAQHLENRMDLSKFDLQAQLDRSTIHSLFNACITQFWGGGTIYQIRKQIVSALNQEYYRPIIKRVKYESPYSRIIMAYVMKYKLVFILWIISKFKKF